MELSEAMKILNRDKETRDIKSFSHMIEEAGHPKSKKSGRYIVPSLILI